MTFNDLEQCLGIDMLQTLLLDVADDEDGGKADGDKSQKAVISTSE